MLAVSSIRGLNPLHGKKFHTGWGGVKGRGDSATTLA